ncbi:DEAD/DEAH box helicase [Thiolapillus sp.]|uniref:DEAD/DEAH box helicase n=1 Tax=Thiolapillus sp. TaxID=2017437 RepID=UPI003AF92B68
MIKPYFASLMPTLAERSQQAAVSQLGFASIPLRHRLRELFDQPFGNSGAFLADPTFEAVFGWKAAKQCMADLEGNLLTSELISAMDSAGEYAFGRKMFPYTHQLRAWEILGQEKAQSLVVTSGTGSGKTECFMVPILDHLQRLRQQHGRLIGVRALFLYPLNALINNQRNRLRAWTEPFGKDIRFCLYNGNTPEKPGPASQQRDAPSEVLDRKTLRNEPPPILVTNSTMLEYMLVRTQDAAILEQSQGKLEWIVLDEAHTYIGSQAAEVALLLRRVLHAFGVSPNDVRFVATSATIGDPEGEAGENLRRFLAEIAGVGVDQVHLVAGERQIPPLPDCKEASRESLEKLETITPEQHTSPERYSSLCAHPTARSIRSLFTRSDRGASVAKLSEVCALLHGKERHFEKQQQLEALRWLDLLTGTRTFDENGGAGESFLPLRAHLFHQTLSGIWACADRDCKEKQGTTLNEETWPFGAIYMDPRKHCGCGSPVYEVATCSDCGSVYLLAGESDGYLRHLQPPHLLDDFELDLEEQQEENQDEESDKEEDALYGSHQHTVLIANRSLSNVGSLDIEKDSRKISERSDNSLHLLVQEDAGEGLNCPSCGAKESSKNWVFRHGRLSAPFLLGNILPTLLEYAPDGNKPLDHPYRGRRLLSFTDSRQGTARMAAKLQLEAERNRVRGLVYHLALQKKEGGGGQDKKRLEDDVAALEKAFEMSPNTALENMIAEKREALAQLDNLRPIAFDDLARALSQQTRDMRFIRQNYRRYSPDTFAHDTGDFTLARMFLVREFGRRPKRANNLETMGMVAICYPTLDTISEVPSQVAHTSGFDLQTWRDFLKICLDFFVRGGGSIDFPMEWKNWLGMRFGQNWLVPHDQEHVGKGLRRWPSVSRGKNSSLLVRLLAYVLNAALDTPTGADRVDVVLRAAWDTLCFKGLLKVGADGRRLPLEEIAFVPMSKGFVCPVTRRFLDTTLNGVTPYLPRTATEATASCQSYSIPLYPKPFGDVTDELERIQIARDWLKKEKGLQSLRDLGLWSVVNDRVIELAPFFKTAEHSAQQDANRLQKYEKDFQEGDINLLSCSTTMEMGIDIGGISLVSMNNVPPHPSSYLQRAGRAGRRQESRSLAMTLCKSNPHDQSVFSNSRWAFDTVLPSPKVSLDSPVIVQRHVQAMLLTHFLRTRLASANQEQLTLNCGSFFLGEEKALSDLFASWCRRLTTSCPDQLGKGLDTLLRHTLYERAGRESLLSSAAGEMESLAQSWRTEWGNLQQESEQIIREAGENSPAGRAVNFHIARLEGEYLLRELANRGFLPAYGFPSHITPFDNYTVEQFIRDKNAKERGREDNRSRFREMPSRDLETALREYAPGSLVVMDGLVYRSSGLTLNWHVPADQEDIKEVQNIKFAWRCNHCGDSGTTHQLQAATHCPSCGSDISTNFIRQFIEPAGFAVDFYEPPNNDIDKQNFIPVEQPWIALESNWATLPNPDLGRFQMTTKGHIFHQSRGINGNGYALCLECGRAEPMPYDDNLPSKFKEPHRKLRRSRDDAPFCPGSDDPWKIKQGINLGHEAWTDICEFQLKTEEGVWLNDEVAATTLAVALRDALAELIGVQGTELACAVKPVKTEEGALCQSILVFDRNAAGYSSSVSRYLDQLFRRAREHLLCPANCDSVCPHCVLDFDQRFAAENMDRHSALKVLTQQWVDGFRLPDEYAFFGKGSCPVFMPLMEAIWQSVSGNAVSQLRLYAGDDPKQWDIGISPLRKLAYQMASRGIDVAILLPSGLMDSLDETDRYLLASLAEAPQITIGIIEKPKRCGAGWLLAEAIGSHTLRWASDSEQSLIFGSTWGQVEAILVSSTEAEATPDDWKRLEAHQIRPAPIAQGDREIEISHQLDGSLKTFGNRFWKYLMSEHPPTQSLLQSTDTVTAIRYQDRYLFSPLSVRILFEIVRVLREQIGEDRWSATRLSLDTLECRAKYSYGGPPQKFLWSDWDHNETRAEVIERLFHEISMQTDMTLKEQREAAHGRLLEIKFASGKRLRVRFDQGVSYWRVARRSEYRSRLFDFSQPDSIKQAKALLKASVPLEGSETNTQLFVRVMS